ncbi:hypothetical protein GSI_04992 [Ganoderma sinense ZZ0214-1]|uniref:Uncharacterized protein n=1 Tax=Ganoderma sinense ZZ0214-1 TaxID=1077348 RepID=A0A2G8SGH7_9APHY|nr:hypothetical protein GSI_04992 [Ganoderma sinense ZZ0214-1]
MSRDREPPAALCQSAPAADHSLPASAAPALRPPAARCSRPANRAREVRSPSTAGLRAEVQPAFRDANSNEPTSTRAELPNSKSSFHGEFPNPTRVPISTANTNTCEAARLPLAKCDQSANRAVPTTPVAAISTHLATCNH